MNLMSDNNDRIINKIIRLMETDESVDAPPDAIRWSKNIFLTRAAAPKKSIVQKILAVLQMDLSPNKATFGERSASASSVRQMLFQAGEISVDLRIKQADKGFSLHGQILGEGFENCIIKLGEYKTTANEIGEFKFAEVSARKYDLSLQSGEKEIVIENLEF